MAILEHIDSGRIFVPGPRAVLGRAPSCDLVLADRSVSGEHAAVLWDGAGWRLRDLGSRNGSFCGEARVVPGEGMTLAVGDTVRFGTGTETWQVLDLDPPDTEAAPVVLPPTVEAHRGAVTPAELGLSIRVSADEEYVEVTVQLPDRDQALTPRAFHDLILVLARQRLGEQRSTSSAEAGWVYFDDLCAMLGRERTRVNVDVFRARQQLAELGVDRAVDLFERRPTTRQIRVGVERLEVVRL